MRVTIAASGLGATSEDFRELRPGEPHGKSLPGAYAHKESLFMIISMSQRR